MLGSLGVWKPGCLEAWVSGSLYPSGIDEKRWVDGVLASKTSLGL